MQESCIFAGQLIAWMAYLFFLAFSRAALLGVGRRGGFYSIFYPSMTGTVGIFPCRGFRRFSYFVDLFGDLHPLKSFVGILVGLTFEVPSL